MAKKPEFRHLFDEADMKQNAVSSPIVPNNREDTPSLKSFNSYPSAPVSTPPTSKEGWTKISRQQNVPRKQKQLLVPATQDARATDELNLNTDLPERVRRHTSGGRPEAGVRDQNKLVRQFHSNLVEQYLQQVEDSKHAEPTGTWLDVPELPTSNELMDKNEPWTKTGMHDGKEMVLIDGNHLRGAWSDLNTYLGAHFSMLREEAIQPLRDSVTWVRAFPNAPEDASLGSMGIYTKVHITTMTFSTRGLGIRVVFSLSKVGKKIRWEQSKRLIAGSLVALTPSKDMFRTKCIVATVAARPLDLVQEESPKVDLFFANPNEIDIDPRIEYTMVEDRTSFFEAVRHVGVSLQKMATEKKFPMQEQIVKVKKVVPPPSYIQDRPHFDVTSVFTSDKDKDLSKVDVLNNFPEDAQTSLDKSQQAALAHIFRRRVALIQGPPGTGKTHVSVMALKIMIANMAPEDPPIVVACQTNHALDQLLRHVAVFEDKFIRLGGRSKDQGVVKEHTLFNVRQKERVKVPGGLKVAARHYLRSLEDKMQEALAPLEYGKDQTTTGFMDLATYSKAGLLTPKQCDILEKGDSEWIGPARGKTPIAQWLGKNIVHHQRTYAVDHLAGIDFEEADLEFEQLKEIEAENVCQDDENDFESLPGNGLPIFVTMSGKESNVSDEQIEAWLKKDNLWKIPSRHRGAVFNYLQRKVIEQANVKVRAAAEDYNVHVQRHRYGNFENSAILLRQQKVIGVTTTGLSKYRALISSVCPRVVMIEEAAEVMEAPVTAGCVPTLEHLILVGDHKQLRPQCGVKMLEHPPWELNISLFERLVENKLPLKTLKRQRRMIPEIRRLLGPIYHNEIKDHISMHDPATRAPVPGMGGINSLFYTHCWPDAHDDNSSSINPQEADMVVGAYDHLISNGLSKSQITVLCFYNGQRKLVLRKLRNHPRLKRMDNDASQIFKVLTVDSYQGEENDVVLLSLARSNDQGKIGFLGVENRICVALSRAKRGFYMFGNAELLACESRLWAKVINIMLADESIIEEDRNPACQPTGRVVWNFPVCCDRHKRKMYIEHVEDWNKIDGGCDLPCGEIMPCGHACGLNCHPFGHDKITCFQECQKVLKCGHKCGRECHDMCKCLICGKSGRNLELIENDNAMPRDSEESSESMGSNARAWQAFAKGGHQLHDAALRETQRHNYLEAQAKLIESPEGVKHGPNGPPSTPESVRRVRVPAITQPPPSYLTASSIQASQPSRSLPQPTSLQPHSAAVQPLVSAPMPNSMLAAPAIAPSSTHPHRAKVSHRDRFKRAAPSATPIITTPAPANKYTTTPAIISSPAPVGYISTPVLQSPLTPRRHAKPLPITAIRDTFGDLGEVMEPFEVVSPRQVHTISEGETLIDFD